MAGRFTHFLIASGAVVGGMFIQGDAHFLIDGIEHELGSAGSDAVIDARIDAMVEREVAKADMGEVDNGDAVDPEKKRALMAAVAELVRAEGALAASKMDDDVSDEVVQQAEERRDSAKDTVERLADDVRAETRGNRDALRQNIREQVREEVRQAVRS